MVPANRINTQNHMTKVSYDLYVEGLNPGELNLTICDPGGSHIPVPDRLAILRHEADGIFNKQLRHYIVKTTTVHEIVEEVPPPKP